MRLFNPNLFFALLAVIFSVAHGPRVDAAPKAKIAICEGEYALCASSTGALTGKHIRVRSFSGAWQEFPETKVMCPILTGPSIAGLNSNTMGNKCKAPKGYVYSLFWPKLAYPQEAQNWEVAKFVPQTCAPQPTTIVTKTYPNGVATQNISQCWSMKCKKAGFSGNGVPLAECSCALGENMTGGPIDPETSSVTGAGNGIPGNDACTQNPISAALPDN